jgi:hypothetical protein
MRIGSTHCNVTSVNDNYYLKGKMINKRYTIIAFICGIIILSGCTNSAPPQETTEEIQQRVAEEKSRAIADFMSVYTQNGILSVDDVRKTIQAADEAYVLDDTRGPGELRDKTYDEKLRMIVDFANMMMAETGRVRLSQNETTVTDEEIPVIDVVTGMNKYFRPDDGESRYRDYLAQRFDIGVYPDIQELDGVWIGEMIVTHVVVFNELGSAPIGYDVTAIEALEGRRDPVQFSLSSINETEGKMSPYISGKYDGLPFGYDFVPDLSHVTEGRYTYDEIKGKGHMVVHFSQTNISGSMELSASQVDDPKLEGKVTIDLFNGYIKIAGNMIVYRQPYL